MQPATTTYRDANSRDWTIRITVAEYMMLRSKHNIDLGKIFDKNDNWIGQIIAQDDMTLLPLILRDLLDSQVEKAGIDDQEFFGGMIGDTLASAADCLIQAVVNFTPVHKRKALQVIVDNLKIGMERTIERVVQQEAQIQEHVLTKLDAEMDRIMLDLEVKTTST